ncbi:RagB/SusD family nutrient uptake outer membrane protein [Larkinella rosea]|uniref:RagB/SusD family nutrient uptake outer membrane protein n=1 Tax=Larkinella rosea TaxID=2025312 RepID=A0A3P1BUL4_9BACT|nr:RagB/SusD family nutrient uptake outer membrane protein [Larkinella rosea]RRB04798.1 RagB/SusD family nutrient uptake outer membrane protein [Larkinella rosea]
MKKINLTIPLLALLMGIGSSCKEILEVTPRSQITNQVFWQSEDDYAAYLNGVYSSFRTQMNDLSFGEDRSESFVSGVNSRLSVYWAQVLTPENARDWTSYYGTIGHINLLLSQIEGFTFATPATKNRIKAEALALRAAMYFYMAKIWGDLPLMLTPIVDENVPLIARSPVADVFKQINADIDQSISLFPEAGFISKNRLSKPAVNALKADVKLWSAKVLAGGEPDFTAALAAIAEVEKSGVTLLANFRDITVRLNNEIIFSLYFNRSETPNMYAFASLPLNTYSAKADNAADLPLSNDPLYAQAGYATSPAVKALFAANPQDKRIPATYIDELQGGKVIYTWPNKFRGTKYSDDRVADDDLIVYRFADIILLKAEALAALGRSADALVELNKIRKRAGIPDVTITEKTALEKAILDERGRELFDESKRWWDLVRFHKGGTIDVYQVVPNLKGKTVPLYWPVATRVLSLNNQIKQTQGY